MEVSVPFQTVSRTFLISVWSGSLEWWRCCALSDRMAADYYRTIETHQLSLMLKVQQLFTHSVILFQAYTNLIDKVTVKDCPVKTGIKYRINQFIFKILVNCRPSKRLSNQLCQVSQTRKTHLPTSCIAANIKHTINKISFCKTIVRYGPLRYRLVLLLYKLSTYFLTRQSPNVHLLPHGQFSSWPRIPRPPPRRP